MKFKLIWSTLMLCGLLVAAGCSDDTDTPIPDVGPKKDGLTPDVGTPDIGVADMAKEMGKDMAKDMAPPDKMLPDKMALDKMLPDTKMWPDLVAPSPDMSVWSGPGVVYVTGTSYNTLGVKRVKTDGTGKVTVPGLENPYYYQYPYLVGRRGYFYTNRDRPNTMSYVSSYFQPMYLPNGLGHLYLYQTATGAKVPGRGFFVVRPDGKAEKLAFMKSSSGTSTSTTYNYYYYIGLNRTGSLMAAAYAYSNTAGLAAVHMIRTDGKKWAKTGNYVCDVTATTPKSNYIRYYSFTFGKKYLYYVARDATLTTQYYLFKAPLDCSAAATKVTLPTSGGSAVKWIDPYLGKSDDDNTIFFVAGATSSTEDIYVLNDATGAVRNITDAPTTYAGVGTYELYYTYSYGVDVSPDGKYLAYKEYKTPYKIYVRPVDKSKKAVLVTDSTNFASTGIYTGAMRWLNNDLLMFWVGKSSSYYDMFTYTPSTGLVAQITTTGGTTKPYAGLATIRPYYGWVSPNGKYFLYVEYFLKSGSTTTYDLRAVDRATGKIIEISKGLYGTTSQITGAANSSRVFFYGYKAGSTSPYPYDIYYFDANAPKAATKLTSHTVPTGGTYGYIYDMMPSDDGSQVAYGFGSSSNKLAVYVAQVATPPVIYQLTATPTAITYVSDLKLFSPDNKSLVYGMGTSSSLLDLRVQTIGKGTTAKVLEATKGYTSPMMFYK